MTPALNVLFAFWHKMLQPHPAYFLPYFWIWPLVLGTFISHFSAKWSTAIWALELLILPDLSFLGLFSVHN
jgi:hypothetical protein